MRFYYPLALILLVNLAAAAEPAAEQRAASLALDFCGDVIGQPKDRVISAARRVSGLTIGETKSFSELIDDGDLRAGYERVLNIDGDTPMSLAAFDRAPGVSSSPYAIFSHELNICLIMGVPTPAGGQSPLRLRLAEPASTWTTAGTDVDGTTLWERPAPFGEKVELGASWDNEMIIVTLAERPSATAAQIGGTARAALEPCVAGILDGLPPAHPHFAPTFALVSSGPDEENAEVTKTLFRSQVDGPRSLVGLSTFGDYSACEIWISDSHQPASTLAEIVTSTVAAVAGARETRARTRGENPELKAWRIKRRGAPRYVDVVLSIEDEKVVSLKVSQAAGLFR